VDLEWKTKQSSTSYNRVALIQIATADTVLLVPTKDGDHSAPKALHILFRDPEIVKVGVGIEEDLLKLWRDFQIEANSYAELNDLMPLSNFDFIIESDQEKRFDLQILAYLMGHPKWKTMELACSNWETRPLSRQQLHCAALDALMGARVFWGMLMGRRVSRPLATHLKANVKNFVRPVCKTVAISVLDKEQRIARLKRKGLCSDNIWDSRLRSEKKNRSRAVSPFDCQERGSSTGSAGGESSGALDEVPRGLGFCGGVPSVRKGNTELKPLLKHLYDEVPRLPPLEIQHDSEQMYQKPLEMRSSSQGTASQNSAETLSPKVDDWNQRHFVDSGGIWGTFGSIT